MIHSSGTFEYEAEFTREGFSSSDVVLQGTDRRGVDLDCLVGHNPTIRFWNDRLVLVASGKSKSLSRNVSVPIGDAIPLAAQPGDRLYLVRTGCGGMGLSVLRHEKLILAIGVVTEVPLANNMDVVRGSERPNNYEQLAAETWLKFRIDSEQLTLGERDVVEISGYLLYIERCWHYGVPGTDECVAISVADDTDIKIAAMRSAILMGNGQLKITSWDGEERVTRL